MEYYGGKKVFSNRYANKKVVKVYVGQDAPTSFTLIITGSVQSGDHINYSFYLNGNGVGDDSYTVDCINGEIVIYDPQGHCIENPAIIENVYSVGISANGFIGQHGLIRVNGEEMQVEITGQIEVTIDLIIPTTIECVVQD